MKIAAIGQRGRKRDFIDLYFLCREQFTLKDLLRDLPRKFPNIKYPSYHLLRAMTYFDEAENDQMPQMIELIEWKAVREFFSSEASRLLETL